MPPQATLPLDRRDELLAIILAVAAETAREAEIEAAWLGKQVTAAFDGWSDAAQASPADAAGWGRTTALVIAGDRIVCRRALQVARRNRSAERAGLAPEDVAQFVRQQLIENPPESFTTVAALESWASTVAFNHIIDRARHLEVVRRFEERPEEIGSGVHAMPPCSADRLAAEYHDVPRETLIIARWLGAPKTLVGRQFLLQVTSEMLGEKLDAETLASLLGTTIGYVYRNRLTIKRTVRALHAAGVIDLDIPRAEARDEEGTP